MDNTPVTKKSFWKSKTFRELLICAAILLPFVGVLIFPAPPLVISENTTRITSPLTADGRIDFFKALEQHIYPPELATDDNGYRLFVRQFGDLCEYHRDTSPEDLEFYRRQTYEKLGLDPDVPPAMIFPEHPITVFNNFYATTGEDIPEKYLTPRVCCGRVEYELSSDMWERPWTLDDFPMLADWIEAIDEPLDTIAAAIAKPVFFAPLLQTSESVESGTPQIIISTPSKDGPLYRRIRRMFSIRAAYRIGQGNIDAAIDDNLTIYRLGRLTAASKGMTNYLIAVPIEGAARAMPIDADPESPITEKQIRRLLEGLNALPPRVTLREIYEQERFSRLCVVQFIQHCSFSDITGSFGYPTLQADGSIKIVGLDMHFAVARYACNWNVVYRRMNEVYDILQEPDSREKFLARLKDSDNPQRLSRLHYILTPGGRGEIVADFLIPYFVLDLHFERITFRDDCADNMQRLIWAIKLYQLDNGKLPDGNWAEKIAKYLGGNHLEGVPEQYFSCPANPSPKGETTYALVQYGDDVPDSHETILLVELKTPMPFDKAVITVDEVLELPKQYWDSFGDWDSSLHFGLNIARRSGAVGVLNPFVIESELPRWLGQGRAGE